MNLRCHFTANFLISTQKLISCFVKCTVFTVFVNRIMNPLAHSNADPGLVVKSMGASQFYTQTNLNGIRWTCPLPWSYDNAEQNYLPGIVGIEFYVPFNGHIFGHDFFKKCSQEFVDHVYLSCKTCSFIISTTTQ